jgi:parallel beta-helix repeat protein
MNEQALFLSASGFNTFSRNNVSSNSYGVVLAASHNNLFSENYIINNGNSFRIVTSRNNTIYHNNFINTLSRTTQRPYVIESRTCANFWDNNVEGNYWSGFNGSDENGDGIGDISYFINERNEDKCPLMGPFSSFQIVMDTKSYTIFVLCNSTISEFNYLHYETDRANSFSFQVKGETDNVFCRICIPHSLIEPPYTVVANNIKSLHGRIVLSNGTHSWLYFTYHSGNQSTTISLSSLEQRIWYQLWFWALIGLVVVTVILCYLVIKYRRTLNQQKKLIEEYEFQLRKRFRNHLEAAQNLFEADVKRRKPKVKIFEKKYNMKIRPRDSFEEVTGISELKKDRKRKESR